MRLSDAIEQFIKEMMQDEQSEIDLKRNELAEYFHCAPSQINYVLSTRFTPDHGYVISSQRGGGGYIRIVRVVRSGEDHFKYLLNERIGDSISVSDAQLLCLQLAERGYISKNDALLMAAATSSSALAVPVPSAIKDAMRAHILRSMLMSVAQRDNNAGQEENHDL